MHSLPPFNERFEQVLDAINAALRHGSISLNYQGQFDIQKNQLIGFEVLSRLHSPALGDIPADEFITVAEVSGLIGAWEEKVWQQLLIEWPQLTHHWGSVRMALNFSLRHITEPDFFESFQSWVNRLNDEQRSLLDFEITETWIQQLDADKKQHLQKLQQQGIQIVMDDFGTGQSSLSRLYAIPFDCIKLDKEFAQCIVEPMVQAIVKSMVMLAQQFDKSLIIEGVETQSQLDMFKALGCTLVQGYLLGKPQPLAQWLKA
jgi:EAL domain-containing protein (putative c-di-GMP-specific phosphodiesterase class I)